MFRKKKKVKRLCVALVALAVMCSVVSGMVIPAFGSGVKNNVSQGIQTEDKVSFKERTDVSLDLTDYFDTSKVKRLSDMVPDDEQVSIIVEMSSKSVLDGFDESSAQSVGDFALSARGKNIISQIDSERNALIKKIKKSGISYTLGNEYNVLFGGFEVIVKASDFEKLEKAVGSRAELIVGEQYAKCESEVVNNYVNVYDTGIFNASDSAYDGSGTVIAVLDTGLDYTHTAFDVSRFEGDEVLTVSKIAPLIGKTTAASRSSGLTAEDVYINKKVPFAFDYADGDADVFPIASEHGTHVSGIIVGNDDVISGVAPNAQLVSMKVFSDTTDGAPTSGILAALEDCVTLGVDVVNMSLGTAAGFSREVDRQNVNEVYDKVAEHGISLVVSASNSYNSTFGSEKNGNLGLTSNPDSGTVGAPSTYDAALSVASVSGVKTPYLTYNGSVIYFTEASNSSAKSKNFVNEILPSNVNEQEFTYVTVPGVGRTADYTGLDVRGKIALVKRGSTSFEDKARIALAQGAAGVIIYNNVSGNISMTVGGANVPVCSISQDNGELLAAHDTGVIIVNRAQTAGPFMSDFSSWGPTPDLRIKPEITAHGGEIYSAVPGQSYDRMSGTSMAAPNQAGVTALVRQYVKENFPDLTPVQVNKRVNQLMMSTADIVYNRNGLPYSVRKQGAGLANLTKTTTTGVYVSTFDRLTGDEMKKAKIELGDDANKTGVYNLKFALNNVSNSQKTFNIGAIVQTEGVSGTLTNQGETTVTEEGYLLAPDVTVTDVTGGSRSGNGVTVAGGESATVTLRITLTDADKKYLDESFENGMYVEGFVTMTATDSGGVNLNVPFLAFYGDWTRAPLFDLDYFATNKDELDDSIDILDKTLPDAYATTPLGGTYNDFITYLGGYNFIQDPAATKIAADRKYVALSNQATGNSRSTVHNIYAIWAGMLRGAKSAVATVTDSVTGEQIYKQEFSNLHKSYNYGSAIAMSSIKIDFDLANYNLKNNTQYVFRLEGYLDYDNDGKETNLNNVFEFPFVVDFQAPVVTGINYYTEYDASLKKTRLFANIDIFDNHYSSAAAVGYISQDSDGYMFETFDKYLSALYSDFNSTYTYTYELTDYLEEIKQNSYSKNSFVIQVMDYALNTAIYEFEIPDKIASAYFADQDGNKITELTLSPNETYNINTVVTPADKWAQTLDYTSSNPNVARVVNGKILAVAPGTTTITARSHANVNISTSISLKVLSEDEEGYVRYDTPTVDTFKLEGYTVNKVYYFVSSDDRDLGSSEGSVDKFGNNYSLSMYPSEAVTVDYKLQAFATDAEVRYSSSNSSIVTVDAGGKITAVAEGNATITATVYVNGQATFYTQSIAVTVKNPYITNSIYLMRYAGNGGEVEIPADLGPNEIYQYAFSGYRYVPKDANDEISEEDPNTTKMMYIGDDTITKVVIPEGYETIGRYAFANLTALEEVVLPSTLKKIEVGAFYGCTSLKYINLENVQFINQDAFYNCPIVSVNLASIVGIGNNAFEGNTELKTLSLPRSAQSLGSRAFYGNTNLGSIAINASKIKLGDYAFAECGKLSSVNINATVIPVSAFENCASLVNVTLGDDVTVIKEFAFGGTNVNKFTVSRNNRVIKASSDGASILSADGTKLIVAQPNAVTYMPLESRTITEIGDGAFGANKNLQRVTLPNVTVIGNFAFSECESISKTYLDLGNITHIGDYAFAASGLTETPDLAHVEYLGNYAFAWGALTTVDIPSGLTVGAYAFGGNNDLVSVNIGNNVVLGPGAFISSYSGEIGRVFNRVADENGRYIYMYLNVPQYGSSMESLTIGDNVTIGDNAFEGNYGIKNITMGDGAVIGDYAFFNTYDIYTSTVSDSITGIYSLDLSGVKSIGDYAFSGAVGYVYLSYTLFGVTLPSGQQISGILLDTSRFSDRTTFVPYGIGGSYAPCFREVNLTSIEDNKLGESAFAFNFNLRNVYLHETDKFTDDSGEEEETPPDVNPDEPESTAALADTPSSDASAAKGLTVIPKRAFYGCDSLTNINLKGITEIGEGAFAYIDELKAVDLTDVTVIGNEAFYTVPNLAEVTLNTDSVKIGDDAFGGDASLASVDLTGAWYIGDRAFAGTAALKSVDVSNTTYLGEYAFMDSGLTSIKLGDKIAKIGDNPFANSPLGEFTDESGNNTYDINEKLKVIDGVLYSVADNGKLVLISYPTQKANNIYEVAEGTVRLSGRAFQGAQSLKTVQLNGELKAIGDKAFYGCDNLYLVVFKSYKAPILEEEYDEDYLEDAHIPTSKFNGNEYEFMNIVKFGMWNLNNTIFYYGANFVDYIGQDHSVIMVNPSNGTGYDTFIFDNYFMFSVDGAVAPTDETISVKDMIAALPDNITLADEAAVAAARSAYDGLVNEQKALLDNYGGVNYSQKLTTAEGTIAYLKSLQNREEPTEPAKEKTTDYKAAVITLSVLLGFFVLVTIAGAVILVLMLTGKLTFKGGDKKVKADKAESENSGAEDGETAAAEIPEKTETQATDAEEEPAEIITAESAATEEKIEGAAEQKAEEESESKAESAEKKPAAKKTSGTAKKPAAKKSSGAAKTASTTKKSAGTVNANEDKE